MSITLDELFDTRRETTLGEVAELREREWRDEDLLTRVEVHENDALMYVSIPFIGFIGVLIDRATGRQLDLGSGVDAAHQVWAHELGVDLEGTNDVLIRGFTDRPRLEALLARVHTRRHVVRRILPNLGDLPIMLRGLRLYFAIPDLHEMLEDGALEIELDPASDLPDASELSTPRNLEAIGVTPEDPYDMEALFGELRSMLAGRIDAPQNGWRLLELSRYGFELDPDAWTEQWSRYIERTLTTLDAPLLTVTSLHELERVVRLLPGATFSLHLGGSGGDIERVRTLAGSPLLSSLTRLVHGGIDDAGAMELARAVHLRKLTDLRLARHRMTATGVKALVESTALPSLRSLNLKHGSYRGEPGSRRLGVGDEGARAIARCCRLPSLRALNLARNGVGDEGARALAGSTHLSSLVSLKLSKNMIGEEGLSALERSTHLSSLEELIVLAQRPRGR
jgi:hypothetical protein